VFKPKIGTSKSKTLRQKDTFEFVSATTSELLEAQAHRGRRGALRSIRCTAAWAESGYMPGNSLLETALLPWIECRDLAAFLPKLYGVAVNQSFGPFFGFFIGDREERDAVSYVAVVANEISVMAAHLCCPPISTRLFIPAHKSKTGFRFPSVVRKPK
jgi:hypothetical protein